MHHRRLPDRRDDGKLWCWDIFNTKSKRDVRGVPTHANPYRRSEPDTRAHHQVNQGFEIRVRHGGETISRTLDRDGFRHIEFRGQYPIGTVKYADKDLPVQVELEAFSPFTPLDLEDSIYPAIILHFTIANTSDREVSGDLLGWMENAVCIRSRGGLPGQLINEVVRGDDRVMVTYGAAEPETVESTGARREDIVFEDFEGDLRNWTAEGGAFEGNPKPNFHHQPLRGYRGQGLADSFRNGGAPNAPAGPSDAATGRLISKPFTIERKATTTMRISVVRLPTAAEAISRRSFSTASTSSTRPTPNTPSRRASTTGWNTVNYWGKAGPTKSGSARLSTRKRPRRT